MAADSDTHGRRRTAAMILTSLLLVLTTIYLTEPPTTTEETTYESLVRKLFDQVLREVSEMRALPPPNDTELKIVSIQYFRDQEKQKVEKEVQEIRLEDIVYKALFLIPQNYSVGEARVKQAGMILSAVAGKRLYVVKEYFDPQDVRAARRTLAHEITHILQNQFRPPEITTFDQRQAWIALIEGDADFTADTYIETSGPSSTSYTPVPGSLDRIKGFPYSYGSGFITVLHREGGWNLVNSAYERPPRSTEEILHPEIYLAGGSFTKMTALTPPSDGWTALLTDTEGEYFIRIMLENGVPAEAAETAAAGWGGENLTLFHRGEVYLVTWRIGWDTEPDASEFYKAYRRMIVQMGGEEIEPDLYHLEGHYVTFARDGRTTMIVSSTDRDSVVSLLPLLTP